MPSLGYPGLNECGKIGRFATAVMHDPDYGTFAFCEGEAPLADRCLFSVSAEVHLLAAPGRHEGVLNAK